MKTILIIDDEPAILEVFSAILEDEGYHTVTAHNGREGLSCVEKVIPHIIFCDIMMPVMDGREVCRTLQKDNRYNTIPLILMTAAGVTVPRNEYHYTELLAKPFELDDVVNLVKRLLQNNKDTISAP